MGFANDFLGEKKSRSCERLLLLFAWPVKAKGGEGATNQVVIHQPQIIIGNGEATLNETVQNVDTGMEVGDE